MVSFDVVQPVNECFRDPSVGSRLKIGKLEPVDSIGKIRSQRAKISPLMGKMSQPHLTYSIVYLSHIGLRVVTPSRATTHRRTVNSVTKSWKKVTTEGVLSKICKKGINGGGNSVYSICIHTRNMYFLPLKKVGGFLVKNE